MEVVDAKHQAKVILKEIMDQHPGDHDLTAIWDVWFERMADGVHLATFRRCLHRVDRYTTIVTPRTRRFRLGHQPAEKRAMNERRHQA